MPDLDALARDAAVLVPASRDTLVVTGPDRKSWLEGLVTCELKHIAPGSGTWGLVLNRQGKIQSPLWVVASSDALWLALPPSLGGPIGAELGRMLIMEDAELEAPPAPQGWFSLHGPESAALAASWAREVGGHAAAIDFTGLGGAALVVPADRAARVLELAAGRTLDAAGWARLRLERGLPEFGEDYTSNDRPHEAALDRRAVNWNKGCYLGQEVVCMQDMRGKVKRSLRVLAVDAPAGAALGAGAAIVGAGSGEPLGRVTSSAHSPRVGAWLAMAMVQLDALGGELWYEGPAGRFTARSAEPV